MEKSKFNRMIPATNVHQLQLEAKDKEIESLKEEIKTLRGQLEQKQKKSDKKE